MKKWIGLLDELAGEDSDEFLLGQKYVKWKAVITLDNDDNYWVDLYKILPNDQLVKENVNGDIYRSLSAAKRGLCKDSNWKSKDFTWTIIE